MRSLLSEVEVPAVDALLTAVDRVMNSNTLLLAAGVDEPVTAANRRRTLASFVDGPLFAELMRAADRARGWDNLGSGPLVPAGRDLRLTELGRTGFRARLTWMLCGPVSPYRRQLDPAVADVVVGGFLNWLERDGGGWSYWSVRPDFLYDTGYHRGGEPESDAAYFEGGRGDTASYLYRADVLLLLLTNGAP
ncbi:hypothetical protein [Micromonospora auratinigra]|uniref:hypothetical protein n=1 Tax=Micromonospora auratinigra TaxID=261654 RepID=UPI000B83443F|nr:hypothetical protein [Micromonospora auratinigra]